MKTIQIILSLFISPILLNQSCSQNRRNQLFTPEYRVNLIDSLLNTAVKKNEIPGAVVYINHQATMTRDLPHG